MSFILDALKKSENERQRQVGPSLADARVVRRNPERPWWVFAVAALLIVNLGVLLFVLIRDDDAKPAPTQQTAAPVQNAPQQSYNAAPPVQTAPQQNYNAAAGYGGQPAQQYQQPPAPQNYQSQTVPTDPSVRSLADEARGYDENYPVGAPNSNLAGAAAVPEGPPMVRQIQPPSVAPLPSGAVFEARTAANAPRGGAMVGNETLPTLDDLSASGTSLPELHLDIHVTSQNPAERFVFVNMRKYLEGETLKEGPNVERITSEGVILNQRGLRFLLPRQCGSGWRFAVCGSCRDHESRPALLPNQPQTANREPPLVMPAPVLELNGARLSRLLRAGIQRLLADQEHLNRINVFPVPDGDTGTNMALTMGAVLTSLRRGADDHAGSTLTRAADAALDGARGNSGAILAQFFLGMGDSAASHAALSTAQFANAVTTGATYARDSLSEPREGTVLTVITDFAAETARLASTGLHDYLTLFSQALKKARVSLQHTSEQLEELRAARVVDAGAQGFVDLLEGMTEHLHRDVDAEPVEVAVTATDHEVSAGETHDLSHRFCTECTITNANIDRRKLREQLAALGSSLVLAGTTRKSKVHIHVNDPAEVFRVASQFGEVTAQKADDMQRQQQAAHDRQRRVAILTDSVADIPDDLLDTLGIHVVPLRIHFGEQSYLDKVGLSPEEFLAELVRNPKHPKTSQPPAGDFRRQFEFLGSHFDAVVSINVTGKVSGTCNAAQSAADRVQSSSTIEVIDSFNASIGQGLLAIYAAELAARGLDAAQIISAVRKAIPLTRTYALIGSMDYAVRGGRVKPAVKSIANALGLSPVLASHPDGRVAPAGMLFGRRNRRAKLIHFITSRMQKDQSYRVGIGHANAETEAHDLLEQLKRAHPRIESAFVMPVGSTLSVHGGPGTLVVGVQQSPSA